MNETDTKIEAMKQIADERNSIANGEFTQVKAWMFDRERSHKKDIDKIADAMVIIGKDVASMKGSRRTANAILGVGSVALLGLISWGYHDIKTDIGIATEIEAKIYIDKTAKELEEGFLDSQDFKKKVISIVTDKFFE